MVYCSILYGIETTTKNWGNPPAEIGDSLLNSLTTVGYCLMSVLGNGYLPRSVFSLLLGASTGNLSQGFIDILCGFMTLDTSTH